TPNLDRVLGEAVALDDHRSCSNWTGPSMTCATTGTSPLELGWWPQSDDPAVPGSHPALPTLAADLRERGYTTALVSANAVMGPSLGLARGYDQVVDLHFQPATDVAPRALALAQGLANGGPFFLHVHFVDPHGAYCAPQEFVDASRYVDLGYDLCAEWDYVRGVVYPAADPAWRADYLTDMQVLYAAELAFWDHTFGAWWAELDDAGLLDDALVVFVTDHGEQLLERGEFGHGKAMGSEENRAAAAFWAKNLAPRAWAGPTVHQDVAATVRAVFGLPQVGSGSPVGAAPLDRPALAANWWGLGTDVELSLVIDAHQLTYDFDGDRRWYALGPDPAGLVDRYDPADPALIAAWEGMSAWVTAAAAALPNAGPPVAPGP
ncbi:MAG: sulfatase-like hydrolase/transferase, partial [Myxococcota bacterium]